MSHTMSLLPFSLDTLKEMGTNYLSLQYPALKMQSMSKQKLQKFFTKLGEFLLKMSLGDDDKSGDS